MPTKLSRSDFNFDLPQDRIAKYPLTKRDASKLLVYDKEITHSIFSDLDKHLPENALLVMNNAKVIPARLYFKRSTGAAIEVLLLEPIRPSSYEEVFNSTSSCKWKCIIGNSKRWKVGETVGLHENEDLLQAELVDRENRIVELRWFNSISFTELLEQVGELPLPPYLNRETEINDKNTYQTVFAKEQGSVAAPTAGLHFTKDVLQKIKRNGTKSAEVTLHVGAGTFLPVTEDNVLNHAMHREYFEVTLETIQQLKSSGTRIAVGTTSLRVLESLYWLGVQLLEGNTSCVVEKLEPYKIESICSYNDSLNAIEAYLKKENLSKLQAATEILILPYYQLRSIDGLITNFHLPESTLLMLIASVVGDQWKEIYNEALANGYRFLSYGDSSLLMVKR